MPGYFENLYSLLLFLFLLFSFPLFTFIFSSVFSIVGYSNTDCLGHSNDKNICTLFGCCKSKRGSNISSLFCNAETHIDTQHRLHRPGCLDKWTLSQGYYLHHNWGWLLRNCLSIIDPRSVCPTNSDWGILAPLIPISRVCTGDRVGDLSF